MDEQNINIPLSVVREGFTDYSDEESWREFRDLLIMRYNAYTRKRDEISQAGFRRQEEIEEQKLSSGAD